MPNTGDLRKGDGDARFGEVRMWLGLLQASELQQDTIIKPHT